MSEKRIKQLHTDVTGWVYDTDGAIVPFTMNGEMAPVGWYRQNDREFNGKYVTVIEYHPEEKG